ncbi:glycosyltransferase N-terminal domain-containing protein [soil metagenome]
MANLKATQWIRGRKDIFKKVEDALSGGNKPVVWMHCASLGEYEQGRPVLEEIKRSYPDYFLLVTFFSPSGYEITKSDNVGDAVFYLPIDSAGNARKFIQLIKPQLVIWVKYEYWFYYLRELHRLKVPVLLISGIFRNDQPFFKWYGTLWRTMLKFFAHFFIQNNASGELLQSAGVTNFSLSGDTRFDRVIDIEKNFRDVPGIENFCAGKQVIVAGSTWEDDEALLIHYAIANPHIKIILAPHEVDEENVLDIKKEFPGSILYSKLMNSDLTITKTGNCLIIDAVGLLSRIYKYADITYVGGGFGNDGVHNVLEPAVYSKPVIFGPEYEKYFEAEELIECGGGYDISNALELENLLNDMFSDAEKLKAYGRAAGKYVQERSGASQKIIEFIQEKRLLIN